MKKGIRSRVIIINSALITVSIVFMTLFVILLVQKQIDTQIYAILENKVHSVHNQIEQRMEYLIENTTLLTTNELMVNALTDAEGRRTYLPKLVENFMEGKDVISLNVVDFDGKPIFQTQSKIPRYNRSSQLRQALAIGESALYLQDEDKQLVVVAPIKYYDTTQGAVVVVFDIRAIANRNLPADETAYMFLIHDEQPIFEYNFDTSNRYKSYLNTAQSDLPLCHELDISVKIGLPVSLYNAPIKESMLVLSLLGLLLVGVGIFAATVIAKNITEPILTLYQRVKASDKDNNILCSPLGTHDELEALAGAFDERTLKLQYQAEHDSLTELPNRVLFIDRLQQAIKSADRNETKVAVLFVDLDRFKEVNDSFGHEFGDKLLKQVADELEKVVRSSDSVARLGGDEFLLLLNQVSHDDVLIDIIQKIMQVFKVPFTIQHHQFFTTASIGIALYPKDGEDSDELIKNADAAMYKAKDEGRNTYCFYTDDMTQKAFERVTLETQLRQAIVNDEFEVYYQPQVDMETKRIIGMESLVRWNHPESGLVTPDNFIPLAEETGMIVEIDRWVMKRAMTQYTQWLAQGLEPGVLSLNLSMIQINHEDFIDFVKVAMFDAKIPSEYVMFEITETQIMRNPEHAIVILNRLKEIGVRLAIDDFGTGHSSLSYLKRLPVDKIKIDQSFVRDIPDDIDDMELTRAIIAMSLSLNMELIAEGVETAEQTAFLQENGCFEAQGYRYYKPLTTGDLTSILQNQSNQP